MRTVLKARAGRVSWVVLLGRKKLAGGHCAHWHKAIAQAERAKSAFKKGETNGKLHGMGNTRDEC